jgi:probable F420-dependent oxidoreductase
MDTGIGYFATHDAVDPAAMARLVEERGHGALYFAEHTHIPARRDTPWSGGAELPRRYAHCYDLFVALTAAAGATRRLRVGSSICLVVERDPIITANEVASVDALSGGRLDFGVGAGWNREEMANHGTNPRTRMRLMRERIEAMQAIWTQEEAGYEGRHVRFERIWSWPKPVQRPYPPILVGGNGERVLERVLAYGDHWMPNVAPSDDIVLARIDELRRRAADAGRAIGVTINATPTKPERLARYAGAGVDRCVWYVPSGDRAAIEPRIERILDSAARVGVRS